MKITSSPWGKIQHQHELMSGMTAVDTASHGGIHLESELNNQIPDYMRRESGWYEEDCECSIPFAVFYDQIADRLNCSKEVVLGNLRNWYPEHYERFTGNKIKEGESYQRDSELFSERHKNDWVGISAFGSWHEKCPQGHVLVLATIGGRRNPPREERVFLVTDDEYKERGRFGYVCDPSQVVDIQL